MLCSTIIPTINRPSLERAVKSVLEQDLSADQHEVIVVNDSGEPLPDAWDWLDSPHVRVIITNRCERSVACNVGAAVAKGKYLKILHDDDYLTPGALKALIDLAEMSGAVWVYGGLARVDNDDNFVSYDQPTVQGNISALLVGGECLHPAVSLIDRQTFLEVGGFDQQLKVREDWDLECRMVLRGDFAGTEQVVARVRIGPIGSTTRWERVTLEHRRVREKMLDNPLTYPRLLEASQKSVFLRGRVGRAYLFSGVLALKRLEPLTFLSRVLFFFRISGLNLIQPNYWRGFRYTTHFFEAGIDQEEETLQQRYEAQEVVKSATSR